MKTLLKSHAQVNRALNYELRIQTSRVTKRLWPQEWKLLLFNSPYPSMADKITSNNYEEIPQPASSCLTERAS